MDPIGQLSHCWRAGVRVSGGDKLAAEVVAGCQPQLCEALQTRLLTAEHAMLP